MADTGAPTPALVVGFSVFGRRARKIRASLADVPAGPDAELS
jgi:hypothetical protein